MSESIMTLTSEHNLQDTDEGLTKAITERGFGVIAVHDLEATLAKKGVILGRGCLVYEV